MHNAVEVSEGGAKAVVGGGFEDVGAAGSKDEQDFIRLLTAVRVEDRGNVLLQIRNSVQTIAQ